MVAKLGRLKTLEFHTRETPIVRKSTTLARYETPRLSHSDPNSLGTPIKPYTSVIDARGTVVQDQVRLTRNLFSELPRYFCVSLKKIGIYK
ncbi:uncharacterized protein YALI1_F33002g [Yarrowia lipolytica]|uniref:Uncharacterized protein n=1 Tax=Yarrowia lipolytica TaxID=4952 RepID=A0A1D8NPZ4_YARLL|nr:hypothetical protein YALI1_F33002g [Yarrowia lipolytica]